jgi:predicted Fe-S protein YdhL (DUF1289 family)
VALEPASIDFLSIDAVRTAADARSSHSCKVHADIIAQWGGIETEAQASYVMAEVRKLLEQQQQRNNTNTSPSIAIGQFIQSYRVGQRKRFFDCLMPPISSFEQEASCMGCRRSNGTKSTQFQK